MTYREYLNSSQWAIVARQAKKRAGHRCQLCYAQGQLHAHHRTYDRLGDESDADIVVLCADCHAKFHDKVQTAKEQWLSAVSVEKPFFYNTCVAQSDSVQLDSAGNVWLMFGATASVELLRDVDGKCIAGRCVRIARSLRPSAGLVVVAVP